MQYIVSQTNKHAAFEAWIRENTNLLQDSICFVTQDEVKKSVYGNKYAFPFYPEYFYVYIQSELFSPQEIALAGELTDEFKAEHIVFTKKYIFTCLTEYFITVPPLKARTDAMIERVHNGDPNPPAWLVENDKSTVGFDDILRQDAIMMRDQLGIVVMKKQENGDYAPAVIDELPES